MNIEYSSEDKRNKAFIHIFAYYLECKLLQASVVRALYKNIAIN